MADSVPPMAAHLTLAERELFDRLGWFTQVRWAAGACAIGFMAVGWHLFGVRFAWQPALAAVAALLAYNLVFTVWSRWLHRHLAVQRRWITTLAHAQIACDLVAVAALVHTIGGVENHFIVLFIFPMIVASEFFRPRIACLYATAAAVLINLIGWGEYAFYDTAHYALEVRASDGAAAMPLVATGAAHQYVFVLQVCFGVFDQDILIIAHAICSSLPRLRKRGPPAGR